MQHSVVLFYMADASNKYDFVPHVRDPNELDMHFCFDPPVLLISLVHEVYDSTVTNNIYNVLHRWYSGNLTAVCCLILSL